MKPLIVLLLSVATLHGAGVPPLPTVLSPKVVLRSPKAASQRPRPKLTPLRFDYLTPMTRLLVTNGIVVDAYIPTPAPVRAKSAPLVVGPGPLRQVKVEYQHKELSGNAQDYVFTISEGMISNHVYRLNWKPIVDHNTQNVPWPGIGNSTNAWTAIPCSFGVCVRWGVDSPAGSQLRFGVPIGAPQNMVPQEHGFFRLEDTGQ